MSRKDDVGTGSDMTLPKKAILASHLDESRGSSVKAAADQYLLDDMSQKKKWRQGRCG